MRFRTVAVLILSLVCIFGAFTDVSAQTINGSVAGVVTDAAGASVPGATVTVTNVDTGAVRTATTDDDGLYRISGLQIGIYSVRAEANSFTASIVDRLEVTVAADAKADFQLGTGSVQGDVTVTADGALLEATQSQVQKSVNSISALELPGRNAQAGLALLNPGVVPNQNGRPGSGFAVNGNRTRSNNFTIDGANNNDQSLSTPRQNLPPEALQEFNIITNTPAAEFGRNSGSYVNQITKSGTNEFHGIGFYAFDGNGRDALTTGQQRIVNSQLAAGATEEQARRAARSVENESIYGGVVGGPIKRDHTFFFGSADFNDFRTTVSSATRAALTPQGIASLRASSSLFAPGALEYLLNTFPVANDPTSQGAPVLVRNPNVTCPTATPNCNVIATVPFTTFNRTAGVGIPFATDFDRYLLKINTRINDQDQLSFRYLIDQSKNPGSPASLEGQEQGQNSRNQSFTINDVYIFSSSVINEARATYSRRLISFPENFGTALGITGTFGAFTLGNINFPQGRVDNVYEFTDNISYARGSHNLKFGANLLRYQLANTFAPNLRGSITYSSLSDFLFDRNAAISKFNGAGGVDALTYESSFFAQDDYRYSPNLTFNLGLRYEYVTTPFGFFSNAKSDLNNFGPRAGFAYNPKQLLGGRMVVRGAFAVSYDQIFQNVLLNVSRNFPRGFTFGTEVSGLAPYNGLPEIANTTAEQAIARGLNPNTFDYRLFSPNKRIQNPMSYQTTASVQFQLGNDFVLKTEYISTKGDNLIREYESNYGFFAPLGGFAPATAAQLRANPNFNDRGRLDPTRASVIIGDAIGSSIYHSGQVTLEKRFSNLDLFDINFGGLQFNTNFTYSKFISTGDDVLGGGSGLNRTVPSDPRDIGSGRLDRAPSGFDQPKRFVASYIYISPDVRRENGFLNRLLSGYEIAGITTLADGTPFSIISGNNALGTIPSGQLATVQTTQRVGLLNPDARDNSFTVASLNSAGQLVFPNPSAQYVLYPINSGIRGSLGANTLRTGGTINTDLSVVKNIRTYGESQRLQIRAEITNIFNRRNFTGIPNNTLSANTPQVSLADGQFLNLGRVNNITGRQFLVGARYFF